jgi:hypothetical protein
MGVRCIQAPPRRRPRTHCLTPAGAYPYAMESRKTTPGKDYFGDFLQTIKSVDVGQEPASSSGGSIEPQPATAPTLQAILAWLKRHGDQSISEIAAGIASPIIPTAEVLKKLAASGLVTIQGNPGIERVHLTRAGVNVSDLA